MKLSAKLREETRQNPLIRAKIPVTILGVPFLSGMAAGDSPDVTFSLRTNFSTGPSLSVSYHPIPSSPVLGTTDPANCNHPFPFSVSLKSGIGVYGSPQNSPLVFTARFNLLRTSNNNSVSNPTFTPSFSLLIKPQFGNFSLRKSTSSSSGSVASGESQSRIGSPIAHSPNGVGVGVGKPMHQWGELTEGLNNRVNSNGVLSGIYVNAKTVMPISKRTVVNCRWGVNFAPESIGNCMKMSRPVLVLNKIGIERVEEAAEKVEPAEKKNKQGDSDTLLKAVCGLMGKEMRELGRQNREIMQAFEEMRSPGSIWRTRRGNNGGEFKGLRGVPQPFSSTSAGSGSGDGSSDFEKWRRRSSKKNGVEETGKGEFSEKPVEKMSEMETELKKAIQASK